MPQAWSFLLRFGFGYKPGSKSGSNIRRFFGRITLCLCLFLIAELSFQWLGDKAQFADIVQIRTAVAWSFFYFTAVVIFPVMVIRDRGFILDPQRLVWDIFISGAFAVLIFALLFRKIGYADAASDMTLRYAVDSAYFSAVTFSTLGFGDYRPTAEARGYAAILGIWGNIHLGVLAGSVFYVLNASQPGSAEQKRPGRPSEQRGKDDAREQPGRSDPDGNSE